MKKRIIFSIATILFVGISVSILSGQSKRSKSRTSISHSKDDNNENYVKTDENGTVKIERKNSKITRLNINGNEIEASDFPKYEQMVEDIIDDIPMPPTPPSPPCAPAPPAPPSWGSIEQDFDDINEASSEEDFEATLDAQMENRKAHLQAMYEEKSRAINEAIELAQQRKKNNN